jgi:hypothetical protein
VHSVGIRRENYVACVSIADLYVVLESRENRGMPCWVSHWVRLAISSEVPACHGPAAETPKGSHMSCDSEGSGEGNMRERCGGVKRQGANARYGILTLAVHLVLC